jgi:hypothetical protein
MPSVFKDGLARVILLNRIFFGKTWDKKRLFNTAKFGTTGKLGRLHEFFRAA